METGFMNRIVGLVLALVVGGLLVGGMLAPTVAGIQETIGPSTSVSNTVRAPDLKYTQWDGSDVELKFVVSGSTGTYTVNGVEQTTIFTSLSQRIAIASNYLCARTAGATLPGTMNTQVLGWTSGNTVSFTLAVVDGVCTFTQLNHDPVIVDLDWLVYADEAGTLEMGTITTPTAPFYTSNTDKLIILGNAYTTGDNDTFYAYYNGELTVNEDYTDNSSVEITRTLASGYADIYNTSVTVHIGDESFTPYFILAPKTVSGHEAGGAFYVMFGVLTLLAIVMLVVVAANGIRNKY